MDVIQANNELPLGEIFIMKKPETPEEERGRKLRELEGKNISHYSVLLGAWIQTRMERDKTLVALSAAAIGLLITILTTVGVRSIWEILLFTISVSAFLITIWSSLVIYQLNSQHLEDAIRGSSEKDPRLEKYDRRSIKAFIIGSVSAVLIGVVSAGYQLTTKENTKMAEKEKPAQDMGKQTILRESIDGVTNLNPNTIVKKSLDGITDLNPQATQQTGQDSSQNQGQNDSISQGGASDSGSDKSGE